VSGRLPVLQIVHGYNAPFFDLANQYAAALDRERCELTTVYLTGAPDSRVERTTAADRVLFLDLGTRDLRGLKLGPVRQVRRLYRELPFRLVIAHRYKALYISLLASLGRPQVEVLGVAHAFGVMSGRGRRLLVRLFRRRVHLLGVSGAVADDLRRDCPFLATEHIHGLLNAVDLPRLLGRQLPREQARRELGIEPGAFLFANVGRYHPDKDQPGLLRAFARVSPAMPEARLLLIGEGRLRRQLQAMVSELGLEGRARVAGPVAEASRYFPAFDVYVSSSDREPFGIVLTEAMAARLPIVCSDCGGVPEVVGEDGLYFRRNDDAGLAERLRAVHRMSEARRRELGERLYRRLELEFSETAFRRRFRALPPVQALFPTGSGFEVPGKPLP